LEPTRVHQCRVSRRQHGWPRDATACRARTRRRGVGAVGIQRKTSQPASVFSNAASTVETVLFQRREGAGPRQGVARWRHEVPQAVPRWNVGSSQPSPVIDQHRARSNRAGGPRRSPVRQSRRALLSEQLLVNARSRDRGCGRRDRGPLRLLVVGRPGNRQWAFQIS